MKSKKYFNLTSILIMFVILSQLCFAQRRNKCMNGNVEAINASSFKYEINLNNSDTLAGFQIPINYDFGNNEIICDSISFSGGRCENFDFLEAKIDNESNSLYITGIAETSVESNAENLTPGEGAIAYLYFTVTQQNNDEELSFRSKRFPDPLRVLVFSVWDQRGNSVECSFSIDPIRF